MQKNEEEEEEEEENRDTNLNTKDCFFLIGYNKKDSQNYSGNREGSFVNASDTDETYDYDYTSKIRINKETNYKIGDKIMIDYNTRIPTDISFHINYVLYLVISFAVLFFSILNIYVRTALYENETIQQFLMLTCFRS